MLLKAIDKDVTNFCGRFPNRRGGRMGSGYPLQSFLRGDKKGFPLLPLTLRIEALSVPYQVIYIWSDY